jgi:hypothetical protein
MKTLMLLLIVVSSLATVGQSAKASQSKSVKPFTLSISSRPTVALGSPVEVTVRLTNMSNHDINGSTGNIRGFSYGYDYDVRDEGSRVVQQKQIDPTHQSSAQIVMLKPGQSRDELTRISEVYDLSPGKYTIQLSMPVSSDPGADVVKSNKITITITP